MLSSTRFSSLTRTRRWHYGQLSLGSKVLAFVRLLHEALVEAQELRREMRRRYPHLDI